MKKILSILVCLLALTKTSSGQSCANYQASFTSSISGQKVNFNNTSTNHPGQVWHTKWQFGDGTVDTLIYSPTHTYANTGTYTVKLKNTWTDSFNTITYCTDSFMATITITAPTNAISGYVYKKDMFSNPINPDYKVWLMQYNPASNMLTAVDSLNTLSIYFIGGSSYGFYSFTNKPAGNYLVKAAITNQTSGNSGYIPTYHDSSLYWNQAQTINHPSNAYYNIWMRTGTVTSGPGFIGGNVTMGANKGTGNGVAGQVVYLKDANNQVIQYTTTDNNGDYSFSNLPVGTYSLYPEDMNYVTTPITGINITASNTNATGYRFGKTGSEIKPKTTAVENVQAQKHAIFPNPANSKLHISWAHAPQNVAVTISDLAGHKIYQSTTPVSGDNIEVNTAQIPTGVYFLILEADGVKQTEKLVIQH